MIPEPWQLLLCYAVIAVLTFWMFVLWSDGTEDEGMLFVMAMLWPGVLSFMGLALLVIGIHRSAKAVRAWAHRP
jgi:hypothetical protein